MIRLKFLNHLKKSKMKAISFKTIVGILFLLPFSANASFYYLYNTATGYSQSTGGNRYYTGSSDTTAIELFDANNGFDRLQGAGMQTLQTSLFQVKDILDVTGFTGDQLFVRTTNGNYLYNTATGYSQSTGGNRYYTGSSDTTAIELIDANNGFDRLQGAGMQTLQTSLFQVKDILDVTGFTGDQLFVRTTNGNYLYNTATGYSQSTGGNRYYSGSSDTTAIELIDANNGFDRLQGAGMKTLQTSLFQVKDILDITGFTGDQIFVAVGDSQAPSAVPLPGTASLLLFGLGLLCPFAKRKKDTKVAG